MILPPHREDAEPKRKPLPKRAPLLLMLVAVIAVVALRLWVVEPMHVSSDSMEPTISEGSTVLMLKQRTTERGSLVSFRSPEDGATALKRVVAVEGQTVAFEDALLVVDGHVVPEPFVDHSRIDGTYFGPVTVPEGHVFVLGDNRGRSIDSRDFGPVPVENIMARVIWPVQ